MITVVMGVAGSGKTTVGEALADRLDCRFADGDDFHSPAAKAKMHAGHALSDEDRAPWLARIVAWMDETDADGGCGVVACSALRRAYRDELRTSRASVRFVYLEVDHDELANRMDHRKGHFMPTSLLDSQLATLEPPAADENAVTGRGLVDLDRIVAALGG
jgi:carbohydrate kinase (thermoresistant glucokinase family)